MGLGTGRVAGLSPAGAGAVIESSASAVGKRVLITPRPWSAGHGEVAGLSPGGAELESLTQRSEREF
jgi:hypothetical protein